MWKEPGRPSLIVLMLCVTALLPTGAVAVPGDVLFSDNFERAALAPWTASNGSRAGIASGGAVSSSPTRGGYTRRNAVTVTSPTIPAAVPSASLSLWVRRGSDAFSEYPDGGEDLVVEYRRADGSWAALRVYPGGGPEGQSFDDTIQLPPDALHGSLALRLRQTSGSNGNFDWWHFDDIVVEETAPPGALGIGSCDDFTAGLAGNWSVNANDGIAGTSSAAFQSPLTAMTLNGGVVEVSSRVIDTTDPTFGGVSLWIRRGADSFSENPDGVENLVVEYLDDSNAWVSLETFVGGGMPGQSYTRNYPIPANGRHPDFRLRFRQTDGSGPSYDFWHVDDVCLDTRALPALQVSKVVATLSDPVNDGSNPKAIPGAVLGYTITVTNLGPGAVDADSFELADTVPPGTALYVSTGAGDPIRFTDGGVASGLSYLFASDVRFSNQPGGGPPFDYAPVPDAQGYDAAVTGFLVTPTGSMNASGGAGDPSFAIDMTVRLR